MFRFLLITTCLAVPVLSNSAGAPLAICSNGLVPEHHVDPQASSVPYFFTGADAVRDGSKVLIKLEGMLFEKGDGTKEQAGFLGFAVQAQDAKKQPIGQFKIVDKNYSQTLACSAQDDTLTHKKVPRDHPLNSVQFEWLPPQGYKGKVKFVGTVAKDGGTYWVRKVFKEINVE